MLGPTPENMKIIVDKAKQKDNGVYRFRGVVYRVRDGKITHIAYSGEILECCGYFNVAIGKYNGYESDATKILKGL